MRAPRKTLALLALLSPLGSSALGAEFEANHLFVGDFSQQRIYEFDPSGAKVGEVGFGSGVRPEGIAFGPNGHLYVSSFDADRVFEFDPAGALVQQIGANSTLDGPAHLAFGPNGHLFVASSNTDEVIEFDEDGIDVEVIPTGSGIDSQCGVAFGPEGRLYVSFGSADRIGVFDVSGEFVAMLGSSSLLDNPAGLAFGPEGHLYIASMQNDRVLVLSVTGTQLDTIGLGSGLESPRGVAFGADGHLYVSSNNTHRIFEFDVLGNEVSQIGAADGVSGPMGIAFAPFRFKTKVTGTLGRKGSALTAIQEKDAVLSIAPGSCTMQLAFTDHGSGLDLTVVLGGPAVVVHGFEAFQDEFAKKRLFGGEEIRDTGNGFDIASLLVRANGAVDAAGFYKVKSAKGSLHHATKSAVFDAKLVTSSVLD